MDNSQIEESSEEQPPGSQLPNSIIPTIQHDFPISKKLINKLVDPINLRVRVETDIDACHDIWTHFSSNQSLFDLWEFRHAFWKGYTYQPRFYCLENNDGLQAVLPLWYEDDHQNYTWFGSDWQEENRFFVKDRRLIPLLLKVVPPHTKLNAISPDYMKDVGSEINYQDDDPKYSLIIDGWDSIDTLLVKLTKKHRYNFRRDYRLISDLSPEIIIDEYDDFKTLRQLNIRRFNRLGEEYIAWADPKRVKTFESIIETGKLGTSYTVRMLTVRISGKIAGVDLIVMYNDCYYPLVCGYDVAAFSGIGNYFTRIEIEDAIKLGMKKIDVLEGNFGWKDKIFSPEYLHKFVKP